MALLQIQIQQSFNLLNIYALSTVCQKRKKPRAAHKEFAVWQGDQQPLVMIILPTCCEFQNGVIPANPKGLSILLSGVSLTIGSTSRNNQPEPSHWDLEIF